MSHATRRPRRREHGNGHAGALRSVRFDPAAMRAVAAADRRRADAHAETAAALGRIAARIGDADDLVRARRRLRRLAAQGHARARLSAERAGRAEFAGAALGAVRAAAAAPARMLPAAATGDFVATALAQRGKRYVWGATASASDPNPAAFDCSELVKWAAARCGISVPDGSQAQRAWVRTHGRPLSVEEALHTPGALLFNSHHVAISLGDGRTIEARGRNYGVGIFSGAGRFTDAGVIPGLGALAGG